MTDTPPRIPPGELERRRMAAARRPPSTGEPIPPDVTAANVRGVFYRAALAKLRARIPFRRRIG